MALQIQATLRVVNSNNINVPDIISYQKIRSMAEEEELDEYDQPIHFTCVLDIYRKKVKGNLKQKTKNQAVKYTRVKASNGSTRYYKVGKDGKKKRIKKEEYDTRKIK